MSLRRTAATARRVLTQLRHDPRTVAMMLVVPCVLVGLLAWIFHGTPTFDEIGAPLLGIFPFVVMFLVTSVATLRERTSGTLERLLTMPIGKLDLLVGYAVAFGVVAVVQGVLVTTLSLTVYGLDVAGPTWLLLLVAVVDAVLGMALGLFVSAFASTEFQAVQFMPAFVLPQFLLCGLLVPRDEMPDVLHAISSVLPLSYAVDALRAITTDSTVAMETWVDLAVVSGCTVLALALGAVTLRRRTP
ncbi:MAG TPA: ABC transporter permease [Actinomycetes bacterium]|jgi:ABC-2 type transport system permease protein|nr:ABC transporter permease [Actinomycetes bacterium]